MGIETSSGSGSGSGGVWALKGPKGPTRWALKRPKGPNVEAGGPLKDPKGPNVSFGKNKKPTPPGAQGGFWPKTWVWENQGP